MTPPKSPQRPTRRVRCEVLLISTMVAFLTGVFIGRTSTVLDIQTFIRNEAERDASAGLELKTASVQLPARVDCSKIPEDKDPHIVLMKMPAYNQSFAVSVAWWDSKIRTKEADLSTDYFMNILFNETKQDEIYIDVGANVGKMALAGLVSDRPTFAFDPLEFDVVKLCQGVRTSIQMGLTDNDDNFHIYRSVVGAEFKAEVNISRPEDSFGKFDQASLAANTIGVVRKPKLVNETIPMVTLDSIIPQDKPIGMVKIDVQGVEMLVLQGMKKILSRESGYPTIIHYEESPRVTQGAGFQLGQVQKLLEGHGYTCNRLRMDITCRKPRKS